MRSPEVVQNDEVNSNILVSWGHVVGHIRFTYLKFNELKVQAFIFTCIKTSYWTSVWDISVLFYILKVQWIESSSIYLHLYQNKLLARPCSGTSAFFHTWKSPSTESLLVWNKLLNLDTSVDCWESPHLKINLKINDSVPCFSLSL